MDEFTQTAPEWLLMMMVIDIFWILDVGMNFITAYYDPSNGLLQMKPKVIAHRYLRTWFFIDLPIVMLDFSVVVRFVPSGGITWVVSFILS